MSAPQITQNVHFSKASFYVIFIACILFFASAFLRFVVFSGVPKRMVESQSLLNNLRQVQLSLELYYEKTGSVLPSDIDTGIQLSWRVHVYNEINRREVTCDMCSNYQDESYFREPEVHLDKTTPRIFLRPDFLHPYHDDPEGKTCIVAIQETIEELGALGIGKKILLVVISPENAVPWYRPVDISKDDLISGRVRPYIYSPIVNEKNLKMDCMLVLMDNYAIEAKPIPETLDEWKKLFP